VRGREHGGGRASGISDGGQRRRCRSNRSFWAVRKHFIAESAFRGQGGSAQRCCLAQPLSPTQVFEIRTESEAWAKWAKLIVIDRYLYGVCVLSRTITHTHTQLYTLLRPPLEPSPSAQVMKSPIFTDS
jgi:hypothetical protein